MKVMLVIENNNWADYKEQRKYWIFPRTAKIAGFAHYPASKHSLVWAWIGPLCFSLELFQ